MFHSFILLNTLLYLLLYSSNNMTTEEKKELKRLYDIEYRKKNKTKIAKQKQEWIENNPEIVKLGRERNKVRKKELDKKYAQSNKEKVNQIKREWAVRNPVKYKLAKYNYVKRKLSEDSLYRFKHNIGCRIRQSFKNNGYTKKSKTFKILGCTFDEFKIHIESQFENWMSWDNYGLYNGNPNFGWDIDHIIPTSLAITEEDVINLNNYKNLQPLCSYLNRDVKKDRLEHIPHFQAWGEKLKDVDFKITIVESGHH